MLAAQEARFFLIKILLMLTGLVGVWRAREGQVLMNLLFVEFVGRKTDGCFVLVVNNVLLAKILSWTGKRKRAP